MASHDVRDVLNLPADGAGPRPAKKQKTTASRPNLKGLAREVQNLGGDNPIAIVPEISSFKKRRFGSRKPAARWEMRRFHNSAREDGSLILKHWRRKDETQLQDGQPPEGKMETDQSETTASAQSEEDSSFAKFNVKVQVPEYSDDQYNSSLTSKEWSKEETDYLMETVRDFDLRWELIWDRYDYQPKPAEDVKDEADPSTAVVQARKVRSMEDLKARYYEIAAKMMALQKPVQYMNAEEFSLHKLMLAFDPAAETRRKKFAENQMCRSKEEAREEEALLVEVKRIMARQDKFNMERRELYNRLDYPHTESGQDLSAFKTSNGLQTLLQNLMTADKSKKRKSLMGTDGQTTPASAGPSAPAASTPVTDPRRESIAASTVSAGGGHRDSIGAADPKPEKPSKKGAATQQPERRKLTEQEEQIYGVHTTTERLSSGPTFRYERINKILTTKSNAQHQRITNTLAELDVPARLNMPTKEVVEQMERLLANVQVLLELRKVSDKLDGELKLENAKKAEREKLHAPPPQSEAKPEAPAADAVKVNGTNGEIKSEAGSSGAAAAAEAPSGADGTDATANDDNPKTNGEKTAQPENAETDKPKENGVEGKPEKTDDKTTRPGSSGGQKRSASELSAISDQNAKRQKK